MTRTRWFATLRSPWTWIVVGTVLRLLHILSLGNRYYFGDTVEYEAAALRLLHGMGVDQASPRAPLYPMFMAFSFWIGGEGNFYVTRLLKLFLAVGLMIVTTRLAHRLAGRTAATLTAFGMAVAPTVVFVSGLLYPTTLYMLLLASFTLVAWRLGEQPRTRDGLWLGALFALGWLTDQVFLAPSGAIGLWLIWRLRVHGAALARTLAIAAITAAAVAMPYMLMLQHQGTDRVFMRKAQTVLHSARTDAILSRERWVRFPADAPFVPLSPHQFVLREGRLLAHQPVSYIHDWVWEFLHFFRPVPDRVQAENRFTQPIVLYAGGLYFLALLTLSILGLGFGAGPKRGRVLLAVAVLATATFYSFFFTQARYRIPIEPQLIVLAALGVQQAFPRLSALLSGEDPPREEPQA
ncbi:MAG: glycosyltransferase family 39 protein [Candidatus Eisenbacteria bacterium]|nr:glycosyltransferase family 39 protein [Candidatus Eisenbacteria bacterium]